jgi:hypothetical protein
MLSRNYFVFGLGILAVTVWHFGPRLWADLERKASAQTNPVTAFTLNKILSVVCDGKESAQTAMLEARKSSGDWASKTVTQGSSPISDRRVYFANGLEVVAIEEIRSKTSKMARMPLGSLHDPNANCLKSLDGSTFPGWSFVGHDVVNGIPALHLKRNDGDGWHAPSLMCAELKRETRLPGQPGKPESLNRLTVTRIQMGEPDERLFDFTGYEEVAPSELQIRLTRHRLPMSTLSEAQKADLAKREAAVRERMQKVDLQYAEHRRKHGL